MRIIIVLFVISLINFSVFSQPIRQPKLVLEINFLEFPSQIYSAKTVSNNINCSNCSTTFSDQLKAFANPSMNQSLLFSAAVYQSVHYGITKINFDNSTYTRLAQNTSLVLADLILLFTPGGNSWMHEEYHRSVLNLHYINSFNWMNRFPIFSEAVSIDHVIDEGLIKLKLGNNADLVRLAEAGIEGEYNLIRYLQMDNFFNSLDLPHLMLYWLSTINSQAYVGMCSKQEADGFTEEFMKSENTDISKRDVLGLDFTAWVYDLFNPNESYENRGIHPSGVGIDRYIKFSDLSPDAAGYIKNQRFLQFVNLLSPMMLDLYPPAFTNRHDTKVYSNIAFRHHLTSFGYDISTDVFIKANQNNLYFTYHHYRNYKGNFPGVEAGIFNFPIQINGNFKIPLSAKMMLWTQPKDFIFKTSEMMPGGLFSLKLYFGKKKWQFATEFEGKTKGWVMGNPYLDKNFSMKFGLRRNFFCKCEDE